MILEVLQYYHEVTCWTERLSDVVNILARIASDSIWETAACAL